MIVLKREHRRKGEEDGRRRKPVSNRKRLLVRTMGKRIEVKQEHSEELDENYHSGFDVGFAQGFEDGHQLAYEREVEGGRIKG